MTHATSPQAGHFGPTMSNPTTHLARHLTNALSASGLSVEQLAERTKVPRTTILHLMAEPVSAILPERVYLRGHMRVLARELSADVSELEALFDDAYPAAVAFAAPTPEKARFRAQSMALSAALGGVAIASVVAAFVSALD